MFLFALLVALGLATVYLLKNCVYQCCCVIRDGKRTVRTKDCCGNVSVVTSSVGSKGANQFRCSCCSFGSSEQISEY